MHFSKYLSVVPVLMGLAAPALSSAVNPEIEHAEGVNVTEAALDKRSSVLISNSKDGVDQAGFYYSVYNDNKAPIGYTEYSDSGRFELGWNTPNKEFLGGKGFRGGSPRTISWDGYFQGSGDYTLAIYGWTTDPVTEWYIVDSHGTGTPGNGHILGQVYSDGGVYDVYSLDYNNVPMIYGVTSFKQYWSVRREHRTTGTVNVANHFNAWKNMGLRPGNPVFQMVTLEGFNGEGYLDFTVRA